MSSSSFGWRFEGVGGGLPLGRVGIEQTTRDHREAEQRHKGHREDHEVSYCRAHVLLPYTLGEYQ
jgi:hypothetical protein